jgi:pimeloyl-ACP methyl ester carboxylesterase
VSQEVNLPPVLFIHGMWADRAHWNRFRRCFEHHGFETHAITLLSHTTPQDMSGLRRAGIMDYVAQVSSVIDSLPEAPVVIGHSMGTLVAQKLAEMRPLRALVLLSPIAPGGILPFTPSVVVCASGNLVDAVLRRPFMIPARQARYGILNTLSPREQAVVYQSFLHESGRALWQILSGAIAVDEREVRCPMLVVVGACDRATPPAVARRIAAKYGADYREYPGQCHFVSGVREVMDDVAAWVIEKVQ